MIGAGSVLDQMDADMPATVPPPYLRIADALKARIASGELRAGDRLPSTRQLAREWNVALATAAKALSTLRHAGLVQMHPRSGTRVAARRAIPRRRAEAGAADPVLTQAHIVRTATAIADAEGLAAVSMRRVAAQLGVAPMSLYGVVDSKEALVLLMTDAAFGEAPPPAQVAGAWREQLERGARGLWVLHVKHPWLAHTHPLTRPLLLPQLIAHAEPVLAALHRCGIEPAVSLHLHVLLYNYVQGMAVHLEREAQAAALTGLSDDDWMHTQAAALARLLHGGRFPAFAALLGSFEHGYELKLGDLFDFGLQALLDGFAATLDRHARHKKPKSKPKSARPR